MKIRTDFVANSSSSSFIISKDDFNSKKDLAIYMLENAVANSDGDDKKYAEKRFSFKDNIKENQNLFFRSINYDTYIYEDNKYYYVETCNNEDFGLEEICIDNVEFLQTKSDMYFYDFENKILFSNINNYKTCEEHWEQIVLIDGKEHCPICYIKEKTNKKKIIKDILN